MPTNITKYQYEITKSERNRQNNHESFVIWFTGLSGSGKSTLANHLEKKLFEAGIRTYALDGDNIRSGLNKGLTFTREDREENNRRIAEVAKLFVDAGVIAITAFISPLENDRKLAKEIVGASNFVEVYVNTPLEVCEARDVKGLYGKAREGEIQNFTGISAPYESPKVPDFEIKTEEESLEDAVERLFGALQHKLNYHE